MSRACYKELKSPVEGKGMEGSYGPHCNGDFGAKKVFSPWLKLPVEARSLLVKAQ